jgi:hypothetical protein
VNRQQRSHLKNSDTFDGKQYQEYECG